MVPNLHYPRSAILPTVAHFMHGLWRRGRSAQHGRRGAGYRAGCGPAVSSTRLLGEAPAPTEPLRTSTVTFESNILAVTRQGSELVVATEAGIRLVTNNQVRVPLLGAGTGEDDVDDHFQRFVERPDGPLIRTEAACCYSNNNIFFFHPRVRGFKGWRSGPLVGR